MEKMLWDENLLGNIESGLSGERLLLSAQQGNTLLKVINCSNCIVCNCSNCSNSNCCSEIADVELAGGVSSDVHDYFTSGGTQPVRNGGRTSARRVHPRNVLPMG